MYLGAERLQLSGQRLAVPPPEWQHHQQPGPAACRARRDHRNGVPCPLRRRPPHDDAFRRRTGTAQQFGELKVPTSPALIGSPVRRRAVTFARRPASPPPRPFDHRSSSPKTKCNGEPSLTTMCPTNGRPNRFGYPQLRPRPGHHAHTTPATARPSGPTARNQAAAHQQGHRSSSAVQNRPSITPARPSGTARSPRAYRLPGSPFAHPPQFRRGPGSLTACPS